MNLIRNLFPGGVAGVSWFATAIVVVGSLAASAQTIPNPGFEADTFTVWPGYVSGNSQITGWTANQEDRVGLNPAGGSPFADNGAIPEGNNVALIQSAGPTTLSTTISGLTVGTTYKVSFRMNARNEGLDPFLKVAIDSEEKLALTVFPVGGVNPYWQAAFEFTAAAGSQTMTLMNDAEDDTTVLVDDFRIAPSTGKLWVEAWTGDADSGVDSSFYHTHAYNFGSAANVTFNGVTFTGVPGTSPAVEGRFTTTYTGAVLNGDANSVFGDCMGLATDFVYSSATIPIGSYQSITINGLTPGIEYVATIFTVAWEDPSSTARWADFSVGNEILTINQDQLWVDSGLRICARYVADASGSVTLKLAPLNPNNVSIHLYGFSNREAVSRFVKPVINVQPRDAIVTEGVSATFAVGANGLPTPTYQWRFNGANIGGATDAAYTIPTANAAAAGDYDVVVSNSAGSATSVVARLVIGLPIDNPSFEVDSLLLWPGYSGYNVGGGITEAGDNIPITGWTLGVPNGSGINPIATGEAPFADNGVIPHGNQVAFLQGDSFLSQTIAGLVPEAQYYVHFYANARISGLPYAEVKMGGNTVMAPTGVTQVGGANPYHSMYSDVFVATSAQMELAFFKSNPLGGDTTLLIDNVAIVPIQANTKPRITRDPIARLVSVADSTEFLGQAIGSLPLQYQWLKNGVEIQGATNPVLALSNIQETDEADYSLRAANDAGTATSAAVHLTVYEPIPNLFNTGVDDKRVALPDGATDPHWVLIENPDTSSPNAIVEDSTVFPIVDGTWLKDTAASKWIGPQFNTSASAVGSYVYRTVIDLTDRDPSTLIIEGRWASDNTGTDIRVNGLSTSNPASSSFSAYTAFVIYGTNANFIAGSNSLDFVVANEAAIGYTGLRVEILRSNLRIPPGTKPEILQSPASQSVIEGAAVTFTAAARGTAPLTFQWRKDGVVLPGQTGLTLSISNATAADAGLYTFWASNPFGTASSDPAELTVPWRSVPGLFGTGLDANGQLLGDGAVDPHYKLVVSADPYFPGPDAITVNNVWPIQSGVWVLNGPDSRWIAPQADQSGTVGNEVGDYSYQTEFDLTGVDLAKFQVNGSWATDNNGIDILLNDTSLGLANTAQFASLTPFTISNGLVAGKNTLTFIVNNAGDAAGPTGLRVDLQGLMKIEPVVRPKLAISINKTAISISWAPAASGQQLQSAPAVSGPWTIVNGASNPHVVSLPNASAFYRVVTP